MPANCSDGIPLSAEFFRVVSTAELVCIILSGVLCLSTLGLFMTHIVSMRKHHEKFTSVLFKASIILSVYPAVSMFSFFALCFPRAHLVCNLCASIYISIGMYNFMAVLLDYFGGKQELIVHTRNDQIRLNFAPLCCCCVPPFKNSRKVLNTVHVLVGQLAIQQIVVSFLSLVLWLDEKFIIGEMGADTAGIYLTVIKIISTLLGVGGLRLMVTICASIDENLDISIRSRILIVVLVLHNLQGFIFNILTANDIPECTSELSTEVKGRAWNSMILILEMFLLGVAARFLYFRRNPRGLNYSPAEGKGQPSENTPGTNVESPFQVDLDSQDQSV